MSTDQQFLKTIVGAGSKNSLKTNGMGGVIHQPVDTIDLDSHQIKPLSKFDKEMGPD